MATRSRISVEAEDGKVLSVYCHSDGYLDGVGRALMYKFPDGTDSKRVVGFINEGDRSSIDLSYKEWRNEDCPHDEVNSVSDFFNGDIEEYGYLYTAEGQWLYKKDDGNEDNPVPLSNKF